MTQATITGTRRRETNCIFLQEKQQWMHTLQKLPYDLRILIHLLANEGCLIRLTRHWILKNLLISQDLNTSQRKEKPSIMNDLYSLNFNYCQAEAQKDACLWCQEEENSSDQEKLPTDAEFFSIPLLMIEKINRRNIFTMMVSDLAQLKQRSSLPTSQPTHQL